VPLTKFILFQSGTSRIRVRKITVTYLKWNQVGLKVHIHDTKAICEIPVEMQYCTTFDSLEAYLRNLQLLLHSFQTSLHQDIYCCVFEP
jgi:hypothetical protein